MRKYLRFIRCNGSVEDEPTQYSYEIGEEISVNYRENLYKCIDIITEEDKVIHCFKQGYRTVSFDW